jgi:hypothetical protein
MARAEAAMAAGGRVCSLTTVYCGATPRPAAQQNLEGCANEPRVGTTPG